MRYLAILALLPVLADAQMTHVYVCPTTPTSVQGAPSNACANESYVLPAQVVSASYLAACTAGPCTWSSPAIAWRAVESVAPDWLMYACPQAGEGGCQFVRKDSLLGSSAPPPPPTPPPATGSGTLTWTLPSTNTDGTPLADLAGVRVYQGTSRIATLGAVSTYTVAGLADGTYTWTVRAYDQAGNESLDSNAASLTISTTEPPPPPPPPAGPSVVAVVPGLSHSPVFGITATGGRSGTVVGFAPIGAACTGSVVYRYRGLDYYRTDAVVWWSTTPTTSAAVACR